MMTAFICVLSLFFLFVALFIAAGLKRLSDGLKSALNEIKDTRTELQTALERLERAEKEREEVMTGVRWCAVAMIPYIAACKKEAIRNEDYDAAAEYHKVLRNLSELSGCSKGD